MQLNIWHTGKGDVSSPGEPRYPAFLSAFMHSPNIRREMSLMLEALIMKTNRNPEPENYCVEHLHHKSFTV